MQIFKIRNIIFKINYLLIILILINLILGNFVEIAIVLITIFLHELSHVITAVNLNLKVKELELFPFGSVARIDNIIGTDPKDEIVVSLAGPITNIFIAFVFKLVNLYLQGNNVIDLVVKYNFYIGLFNLIPLFPLDGGRILRSILSYYLGFKGSTKISSTVSYFVIINMIIYGAYIASIQLSNGLYLILLAIFIYIAARREKEMAAFIFIKEILDKKMELSKREVMKTNHLIALKNTKAESVLSCFLPKKYHIIIIVDNDGNIITTLSEKEILDGVIKHGMDVELEKLLNDNKKW